MSDDWRKAYEELVAEHWRLEFRHAPLALQEALRELRKERERTEALFAKTQKRDKWAA